MKKVLNATAIVFCLFFYQIPYSFCQDTQSEKPKKEVNKEDSEDEGDLIKEDNTTTKKKVHQKVTQPVAFGIEGGLNISDLIYGNGNGYSLKTGGIAGVLVDIHIASGLYIQPGLFYAMNGGAKYVEGGYTYNNERVNINTLDLPINIIYKFGRFTHFFIGVSAYVGYNFSGTYTNDDNSTHSIKIGTDADKDDLKPIDIGLGANLGLELKDGLFFNFKDREGISNLAPYTGGTIKTSSISLEIGYLFKSKAKNKHHHYKDDEYIERKM